MKIIITHTSPDWDAITSVWLIKRFLPGWDEAKIEFVPAGEKLVKNKKDKNGETETIEQSVKDEMIHVDTGMGPLDHHQTLNDRICAASLTWDFVKSQNSEFNVREKWKEKKEAIDRIIKVIVDIDHFKEVFWPDTYADYQEFSLLGFLEGLKIERPNQDGWYIEIGMECLDAELHNFENRIWAEKEIQEKGQKFTTRFGKGFGIESINDSVLKLAQKMGYMIVVRKDPRKGYVRIKARPKDANNDVDLTLAYEKLKKMDPNATWYLHVSRKMLLNGTPKNPKMKPTMLSLQEIVKVLEHI